MLNKMKQILLLFLLLLILLPQIHPVFSSEVSTGKESGITTFGIRDNVEEI